MSEHCAEHIDHIYIVHTIHFTISGISLVTLYLV